VRSDQEDAVQKPESTSLRNDDALLARVTEKLLGSGQFKALILCIGVAVGLAAAGSLVIAGQTFFTAKDLRSVADTASKNINDLVTTARGNADAQAKLLDASQRVITESQIQFKTTVATAGKEVQEQAGRIQADLNQLKDSAVEEVVKKIRTDLGKGSSSRIIEAADEEVRNVRTLAATKLEPLRQLLGENESQQKALKGKLDALDELTHRVDEIRKTIEQAANYAKAATDAESAAQRAAEAATSAQTHRDNVYTRLKSLDNDTGAQLIQFGGIKSKLDNWSRS
jgi:hypothetical protein